MKNDEKGMILKEILEGRISLLDTSSSLPKENTKYLKEVLKEKN